MSPAQTKRFSFASDAQLQNASSKNKSQEDTFFVVEFHGNEGLGKLFRFSVSLASRTNVANCRDMLENNSRLTLHGKSGDTVYQGMLDEFQQTGTYKDLYFYKTVLRPKAWQLMLARHNQVFLQKSIPDVLKDVLVDGGLLEGRDFELRLKSTYPKREYVCQYEETHYDFMTRWLEHEGMYYFFEPGTGKMVITDTKISHQAAKNGSKLSYAPRGGTGGSGHGPAQEAVHHVVYEQHPLPESVLVKDYNYRTPSLNVKGKATVAGKESKSMPGQVFSYGERVRTPSEAKQLANIRAQELLCREKLLYGKSTSPSIVSGYTYQLDNYYRDDVNGEYLVIQSQQRGSQVTYLTAGLGMNLGHEVDSDDHYYANSFTAIPSSTQFHPVRQKHKRRIYGVMNAYVDGNGSGEYAHLDDQGRYKVILPFDKGDKEPGKASAWVRMAQPYAGKNHGMHFPLHKGTEVLLSFQNGNPDRPVILSAVPNPTHKSLVTRDNPSACVLRTKGGNSIRMEDQKGSERILLQSPSAESFVRLGTPNDPPSPPPPAGTAADDGEYDSDGFAGHNLVTSGLFSVKAGTENAVILGETSTEVLGGACHKTVVVLSSELSLDIIMKYHDPFYNTWVPIKMLVAKSRAKKLGISTSIAEENTKLAKSALKLRKQEQSLKKDNEKLASQLVELAEQKEQLQKDITELGEEIVDVTEERDGIMAEHTKLGEELIEIRQKRTSVLEEKELLAEQLVMLKQTKSELAEAKDDISESKISLEGSKNTVTEDYNALLAFELDL